MRNLILALTLLLPVLALGDDSKTKKKPKKVEPVKVTYFVKAPEGVRPTKNLIYIFDCSTSMGEDDRFNKATGEIKRILQYPLDDGMFSMFGFKTNGGVETFSVWPGIKEKNTPKEWARLPSLVAVKSANKFLNGISCDSWTNIYPAIERAFKKNANKEKLTIILFTDGNNTYPGWDGEKPSSVIAKINKLQKARLKAKKDKILIFVFGVGVNQNVGMLSGIARAGGGSYLTTENYCKKCANHKKLRADFQQFHEAGHKEMLGNQEQEAPPLDEPEDPIK